MLIKSAKYDTFDVIVEDINDINKSVQQTARINKAQKLKEVNYKKAVAEYDGPSKQKAQTKRLFS